MTRPMRLYVNRLTALCPDASWIQIGVKTACVYTLLGSLSSCRAYATREASTGQRRTHPVGSVPYLTTDDFGRPTLIRPSASGLKDKDEGLAPGPSGEDTESLRRGRKGRQQPRALKQEQSLDSTQYVPDSLHFESSRSADATSPTAASRHGAGRQHAAADNASSLRQSISHTDPEGSRPSSRPHKQLAGREQDPDMPSAASSSTSSSSQPRSPRAARAAHTSPDDPDRLDRTLTYRLLKSTSLRELDQLLRAHSAARLNIIHLAATARQAVLLGGLPQPQEARGLLDKYLGRWASQMQQGKQPLQQLRQEGDLHSGAAGRAGTDAAVSTDRDWPARAAGRQSDLVSHDPEPSGRVAAAMVQPGEPVGPATPHPVPGATLPLSELGDVLWAYGKLRCKPPEHLWASALRPMVLDPLALQQLREQPGPSSTATKEPKRHRQEADGAELSGSSSSDGRGTVGQTTSKLAVALARMRQDDLQVWKVLARAAAATAPDMSSRTLSSILWAFGSRRMTHGSLLSAAVRSMRPELPNYNGQDLACCMWALARLAPPDSLSLSSAVGTGDVAAAAAARAAAAAAEARRLLYGELSDAVRRRLQQQGFKPQELTTLVGALDEMARHQAPDELVPPAPLLRQGGSAALGAPRPGGQRALQASPRLLRVVSQAIRKSLSSLPVGALAEAAAAFHRLGHHDTGLNRALAVGMLQRLRHLEPRHLVRAATALQAAGYEDGVFYAKVLEAAQSRLQASSLRELLLLTDVCRRLVPADGGSSSTGSPDAEVHAASGDVSPGATEAASKATSANAEVVSEAVRAFMHAAVEHTVAAVKLLRAESKPSGRRRGAADAKKVEATDQSDDGSASSITEPLKLRHWHQLLRTAAVAGWADSDLAGRALDQVLLELRSLRGPWLTTVRTRAGEQARHTLVHHSSASSLAPAAEDQEQAHDLTMGDVAGVLHTAALLGQRHRIDVVAAVVAMLLEASSAAATAAARASAPGAPAEKPGGAVETGGGAQSLTRLGLAPAAAAELVSGLDAFAEALESSDKRATRAAAQMLRQRLQPRQDGGSGEA